MLNYLDKIIQNQKQLQPGLIYVDHFLQTTFSSEPGAILQNLGPVGASTLISKNALSINGKTLSLKQVTPIKQEAYNNKINRFLPTNNYMILLNIGPETRQYYTRITTLLLKPGDMIMISPDIDVFYGNSMMMEVFVPDDKKKEQETLIILMEN
jgi:hypothetical protein